MPKGNKKEDVAIRLGRRSKELRIAKGLTQMEMSALSGLGQAYLSRVESGAKRICIDSLDAIATALNVTLSELLNTV
jgi:transcriptional regulator with XRE-family HTH domain